MQLIAEGMDVMELLKRQFINAGLMHRLNDKFKQIVFKESNTYGKVDLRLKLFTESEAIGSDYVLQIQTARPNGNLTNAQQIYAFRLRRIGNDLVSYIE